jgi:hypothetical protein
MFKKRFLIVLGVLSLLLVAMMVSSPLSNTSTSAARGRAADAARWTAMGAYYKRLEESQNQPCPAADTACLTAMELVHERLEESQNQPCPAADTACLTAMELVHERLEESQNQP